MYDPSCIGTMPPARVYREIVGVKLSGGADFLTHPPAPLPSLCCRSVYNFFIAGAALKEAPPNLRDVAPVTSEEETKLPPSETTESQDGGDTNSCSSAALDEPRARGLFDKRRQPAAGMESGNGNGESPPAAAPATTAVAVQAAAVPAAAPAELGAAVGFVAAFGISVEKEQHPTGVRFGLGVGAGSAGPSSSFSSSSSIRSSFTSSVSSNSVGPVSAGDIAAATAGQEGHRSLDQQDQRGGDAVEPLPLWPSVPSARTSSISAPDDLSEVGGNDSGGLEMLHTSELGGAEVAGILDAVDELLGEGDLEGFEEAGSEEGMLPFVEGSA